MAKTALVTGAAAGIGRACARRLARDGIQVGVLDRDSAQAVVDKIAAEGGRALALQASIADRAAVEAAVRELSEAQKEKWPISEETIAKTLPVRRTGIPEDIASACAWLCQEDAGYVTGQTIGVNGGRIIT